MKTRRKLLLLSIMVFIGELAAFRYVHYHWDREEYLKLFRSWAMTNCGEDGRSGAEDSLMAEFRGEFGETSFFKTDRENQGLLLEAALSMEDLKPSACGGGKYGNPRLREPAKEQISAR